MSEFETATLIFQQATVAVQQTQAWITLGIGVGQILLIAWGLGQMRHASKHRDDQHRQAMRALEELIRRTAPTNV